MTEIKNSAVATGWLLVGLLNDHFPHPEEVDDDPVMGTGGCVIRCGPCGALKWFSDNARGTFEDYVRMTGYHVGGWCHWDDADGGLRWDWFEAYWAGHKGCASSNGVVHPCDFSEDDEPEPVEETTTQ